MKKSAKFLLSFFVIFLLSGVFINSKIEDYDKSWSKVEKFVNEGLPKSALKLVDDIYKTAKSEGNSPQITKSLIYRISLQSRYEEDHILKSIAYFENEIGTAEAPVKQILNSLVAELYQGYYSENRWKINQRGTLENYENSDISTWDAASFSQITKQYYLQSTENKTFLKSIKLNDYDLVLTEKDTSNFNLYPTLYDLLANRAIDYFTGNDGGFDEIEPLRTFDFSLALMPTVDFLKLDSPSDSHNEKEQIVMDLFKDLIELHSINKDTIALVDLEIRRLEYYRNKAQTNAANDNIYLQSLFDLKTQFADNSVSVQIAYEIAQVYLNYGEKYNRLKGEKYRWDKDKAVKLCEEAVNQFPNAIYADYCRNLVNKVKKQSFQFTLHKVELPENPFLASLSFKNTSKLFFRIVRIDGDGLLKNPKTSYSREEELKLLKQNALKSWEQELPNSKDFQQHVAEVKIPALGYGLYYVFASTDSEFSDKSLIVSKRIWISKLSYILKSTQDKDDSNMFVIDRESGKGVADVEITVYTRNYNNRSRTYELKEAGKTISEKGGLANVAFFNDNRRRDYIFRLEKDGDILISQDYMSYYQKRNEALITKTWLFTDRAIYRPGQTIYFKGIVTENIENDYSLKTNSEIKLEFKNANYKNISENIFVTNKNGSFSGEFVIPKGLLNGNFTIKSKYGSTSFKVEEYKRPTFHVVFDTLKEQYKIGDFVELKGTVEDYSGSVVEDANVKFTVKRSLSFLPPWHNFSAHYYLEMGDVEIENGEVKTDANGNFTIGFKASSVVGLSPEKGTSFNFNIYADAIDITGETQSGYMRLKLSESYINLEIIPIRKINTTSGEGIEISVTNSVGTGVEAKADIKVYKLKNPATTYIKRDWDMPDVFLMGKQEFEKDFPKQVYKDENDKENLQKQEVISSSLSLNGKQKILKEEFKNMKPGEYLIVVSAIDKLGGKVETKHFFSLYSPLSTKVSNNEILSVILDKTDAQPGEDIVLSISSADKKTIVFYEINNGNQLIDRQWLTISNKQKNITIPVREEYRGNFSVNVYAVKHNRFYSKTETIQVPFDNKKLDLKLETFRDYLTPGAQEEWRLTIKGPKGEVATAEVLAAMYDASLDKFVPNNWGMSLYRNKSQNSLWKSSLFAIHTSRFIKSQEPEYFTQQGITYPMIDWFGYEFQGRQNYILRSMASEATGVGELKASPSSGEEDRVEIQDSGAGKVPPPQPPKNESETQMPLRTNFSETAFFYPNLKTDAEGNTIISFKTPDALTEWKFMALAHSNDLKIGNMVKNIKARKELMVMPNVPRFVRQGDQINFTAKVVNFTEDNVLANVEIEFFDAVSMKPISIVENDLNQNLKIAAKSNTKVSWMLNIPDNVSMISYRLKAKTDNYSDGEERAFPVLTNRILVTETMPMFMNANENKTYDFKALVNKTSSSIKNYRYTVEVTSNPVWYAIQALPYLSESKNQSTLSAFNRYYSNSVSSFIVNSNPDIKRVFESWQQLTPDAFLSNLQKNEELKNAVLEATPWVLEAEDETEQKRRIGVLFDLNRLANEQSATLEKLLSNQMSSGAWPWFNGMREDVFTTQKIALGFAKLHDKGIIHLKDDRQMERMIKKAVSFLDKEMVEDYEDLKKKYPERMKNNNLGSSKIQYLYLRALLISEFPIDSKTQEAFNYYSRQAKKYWLKQNEYLQGMIAVSLNKLGYINEAEAIVRSLNERSLQSEEMGMYWRQKRGWHWYEAPIETQAMLIEAFAEIENNTKAIEQMKVWLLKQKQTQRWNTSSATLEAVFALLTTGDDLIVESKDVTVKVGGEKLETEEGEIKEAGTGYFKVSWNGEEVNNNLANIELENPNNNIAWAAAYWQYFEDLDKVKASSSPLSIEKKFFVEKFNETGTVIEPLKEGQKLKTGQKLISRMIIRTDRNMEFVHLKDMRSSALEPISNISGYKYSGGLGYYENITDVSTDFFFRFLRKGTYVLEYAVFVSQSGKFSNGIATIQSMYAPEFAAHSEGVGLVVE